MRKARVAILLAALVVVPALAFAQRVTAAPKLELGMDLGLQYNKPSEGDGYFAVGTPVPNALSGLLAPVSFRLGFVSRTALSFEVRFTGGVYSSSSSGGGTVYSVGPGLNVLYTLGGEKHNNNTYITGGASFDLIGVSGGGTPSESHGLVTLNAGVGMRRPWGSNASRAEAFFGYTLENVDAGMPKTIHFGLRLGFSLFN